MGDQISGRMASPAVCQRQLRESHPKKRVGCRLTESDTTTPNSGVGVKDQSALRPLASAFFLFRLSASNHIARHLCTCPSFLLPLPWTNILDTVLHHLPVSRNRAAKHNSEHRQAHGLVHDALSCHT